ncbi:MAG: response regulator, partial [Chloroflexi bacterium]|nr:response regulator [Chloroflexota bacterium]
MNPGVSAAVPPELRTADALGGRRPRLLVVDDAPALRELLESVLTQEGFEVMTATSGAEARRLALQRPPDVVVMDLDLPAMDGMATLAALRRHGDARVVIVSATSDIRA